jgi:hypothetical protein
MAGSILDTGQYITYLLLLSYLPIFIIFLIENVIPRDPTLRCYLMATILRGTPWRLWGIIHVLGRKRVKRYIKPVRHLISVDDVKPTSKLWPYLLPTVIASFRVGCWVESFLRRLICPSPATPCFLELMGASKDLTSMGNNQVRFDSDSYPVGINNHALRCMVNSPHLFEDLKLSDSKGEGDRISKGLAIKETGTFKFILTDDNGKSHIIHIKNSLYLPGLKCCLLSPQHWVQEAGDNKTWMGDFACCCILHWGEDFMKTIPFDPLTNTPIFFMAPSSCAYCAFTTTYEGFEANFFQQETVLKLPGCRLPREDKEVDIIDVLSVDEIIAKKNLHQKKKGSSIRRWVNGRPQLTSGLFGSSTELLELEDVREDDEEVREDDKMIQMANSAPNVTICQGPITLDPSPPLTKDKDASLRQHVTADQMSTAPSAGNN